MLKHFPVLMVIGMALCLSGCTDKQLQTASKSMVVLATATSEVQKDIQLAADQKIISDDAADKILAVCLKINFAGKQVDAILRSVTKLDPTTKKSLIDLITPVIASLDPGTLEFTAGIKDPVMKQKLEAGLALVRTTLSSIQLTIAAGG